MIAISTKNNDVRKDILALVESIDQSVLPIKETDAHQDILRQNMELIYNRLGKANMVRSVRGKQVDYMTNPERQRPNPAW